MVDNLHEINVKEVLLNIKIVKVTYLAFSSFSLVVMVRLKFWNIKSKS